jgi:hypothetical protein
VSNLTNKLDNIVAEVEMDLHGYHQRSPFRGSIIESSNKISAIGIPDYAPKESPFWDGNDNIFEINSNVLYGGGIEPGQNFITDDDFLK